MNEKLNGDRQEWFEFLEELRESGVTNMLGAGPYLEVRFLMEPQTARRVLRAWLRTFSARERVRNMDEPESLLESLLPEECECCGYEHTQLTAYPSTRYFARGKQIYLCEFCAQSQVGSWYEWPEQHDIEVLALMKHCCVLANILSQRSSG